MRKTPFKPLRSSLMRVMVNVYCPSTKRHGVCGSSEKADRLLVLCGVRKNCFSLEVDKGIWVQGHSQRG